MGWIVHHAIVVTTYSDEAIGAAYRQAQQIFPVVSPPVESEINGYWSLFIPPDGSKEGWPDSDLGDTRREQFATWIRNQAGEDDANVFDMIEVAYGEVAKPVVVRVDGKRRNVRIVGS